MPQPGEDYYDDSSTPPPATKSGADAPKDGDGEDDGAKTSILPRSFFPNEDLKVGDKCDVEVKAIHENDVEVEYAMDSKDDQEDQPQEQEVAPQGGDDGSMSSMMG